MPVGPKKIYFNLVYLFLKNQLYFILGVSSLYY